MIFACQFFDGPLHVTGHAEMVEVKDHAILVEDTQNDLFAIKHRVAGNADIDDFAFSLNTKTAIEGEAFFDNVHFG